MTRLSTTLLDARDVDAIARDVLSRIPAYVPGWRPLPSGAGEAVAQIYARYLKTLADRINQAPDKNALAMFDLLGIELLPAQAARAPVVFTAMQHVGDSRVAERTRVGAQVEGKQDPLVFETERAIALVSANLADVFTLWPGRDAYADHSAAAAAGIPFTLFERLQPVPHALYIAHDGHLALTGRSMVEVRLEMANAGGAPLDLVWEFFDGSIWRAFKSFKSATSAGLNDSLDGSAGLTRSGIVRLVADCTDTVPTTVNDVKAQWIRARTTEPLLFSAGSAIAEVDRIGLRTTIDRSLPTNNCAALSESAGILADQAYAGETKLDLTKTIQPFGLRPQIGSAFYLSDEEILSKPGAEVTLCYRKVLTPEEKADQQGAKFELDVKTAQKLVTDAAIADAQALIAASKALQQLAPAFTIPADIGAKEGAVSAKASALTTTGVAGIQALDQAANDLRALFAPMIGAANANPLAFWDLLGATTGLSFLTVEAAARDFRSFNDTRFLKGGNFVKSGAASAKAAIFDLSQLTPFSAAMAAGATLPSMDDPTLAWEYWNGARWTPLAITASATVGSFRATGTVTFVVPPDVEPTNVNSVDGRWIRARLVAGGYGLVRAVTWKDADSGKLNFYPMVEYRPPTLEVVRLGYRWRSSEQVPERVFAYNDFAYADATENAAARGDAFAPLAPVADRTPALYLGFDAPLPADLISLYIDIEEVLGETDGPPIAWEYYDGSAWLPLRAEDDTHALALPGMSALLYPGVAKGTPAFARFGAPRTWVRARLETDREPRRSVVNRISVNAAWAAQLQTFENETLGGSNGQPDQVFFARSIPVLDGEVLEVRELSGARAAVEEPVLRHELARAGVPVEDIRVVRDARSGKTSEVWVRWHPTPNLLFALPGARAYAIERTRGRILFGGRTHGLIPPAGTDNIRLTTYRAGGGVAGNVPRGALTQILAGVLAQGVSNVRDAEGGADGETVEQLLERAPASLRDRRQAITAADYESMALEASPAVAVARALPTTHPSGRFAPGWVTVKIVPQSADPRPMPSFELRQQVQRSLAQRAPAAIAKHIAVIPPTYLAVGVQAVLAPSDPSNAGPVLASVTSALKSFLHPLTGGPEGEGWPFGRDVFISDVASMLESIDGVDYVETLTLLLHDAPVGDRVAVPVDRMVVAGSLLVTLSGRKG
ncbi:MAG: putative baseplate assembly protein [Gemmatimonadaceae bacterium]